MKKFRKVLSIVLMGRNLSNQGTGIGLYRDKAFRP